MNDFYLDLHSEASKASFSDNVPGSFRSKLTEPIILDDGAWDVAIASISQYYETSLEDVYFIREKRAAASQTPGVTVTTEFPAGDTSIVQAAYTKYLKDNEAYYGFLGYAP